MSNNNFFFLREIHPCLREMFYKLCTSNRTVSALRPIILKDNLVELTLSDSQYTYAYRVLVPYCASRLLKWDVIFNPHDLTCAPDFDFNDVSFEEFVNSYDMVQHVPEWVNWSIRNSEALELIIKGFISLFTEYQVNNLSRLSLFISKEYNSILSLQNYKPNDIELCVDFRSAEFLIALHVRISQLPEYTQQVNEEGILVNPKSDYALLSVTFHETEGRSRTVRLNLSPRLDQFLGKGEQLIIPSYSKPLAQYIPDLTNLLQKHIDETAFHLQFKREFVASLLALRSKSLLEYDSFHFKYVTFLCEVNGYYSFVQVKIGDDFPRQDSLVEIIPLYNLGSSLQISIESGFSHQQCPERTPDKIALHFLNQLKTYIAQSLESDVSRVTGRRS